MLLMTDGMFNTSYSAGADSAAQTTESIARAKASCDAMKASPNNIQIYTVGFQTTPDAEALLRYCASTSSNYYDANDSAQLMTAFRDVVKKLQQIRVSQ
jgi:dihydroorotase